MLTYLLLLAGIPVAEGIENFCQPVVSDAFVIYTTRYFRLLKVSFMQNNYIPNLTYTCGVQCKDNIIHQNALEAFPKGKFWLHNCMNSLCCSDVLFGNNCSFNVVTECSITFHGDRGHCVERRGSRN